MEDMTLTEQFEVLAHAAVFVASAHLEGDMTTQEVRVSLAAISEALDLIRTYEEDGRPSVSA